MSIEKVNLSVFGMHCNSCEKSVKRKLETTEGVLSVDINHINNFVKVDYDSEKTNLESIKKVLYRLGYDVLVGSYKFLEKTNIELSKIRLKLIFSFIITGFVFLGYFLKVSNLLLLIGATIIQFIIGGSFLKRAFIDFKERSAGAFTLISFGTLILYFYSFIEVFFPQLYTQAMFANGVYIKSVCLIITFILLGQYLEVKVRKRASQEIKKLLDIQAKKALLVLGENDYKEVPVDEISVGDVILVRAGDKIPVDGKILNGRSYVDESNITGFDEAILKNVNSYVVGSSINLSGTLKIKALKVGAESYLREVVSTIEASQNSKIKFQEIVDYVTEIFTPITLISSLITFLIWFNFGPDPAFTNALISMVSVLIISCPCALSMSTPTALMAAIAYAAKKGILIKKSNSIEIGNDIDAIIIDKTGTLTEENKKVAGLYFSSNLNDFFKDKKDPELFLKSLMFIAESKSNHPISRAIVKYFFDQDLNLDLEIKDLNSIDGLGIEFIFDDKKYCFGSKKLLFRNNIEVSDSIKNRVESLMKDSQTVSYLAVDNICVGFVLIDDILRKPAKQVIKDIKKLGISPFIMSGDNEKSVKAVADKLGVKKFFANVLPDQKEDFVFDLKAENYKVSMVGDGINDSKALVAADLGMSMSEGTDIANESSDVILLYSDLELVPKFFTLAKETMKIIKQNLIWSFGYNILFVPLAMGVLYPVFGVSMTPFFAGIVMTLSSLSVVFNSFQIRKKI